MCISKYLPVMVLLTAGALFIAVVAVQGTARQAVDTRREHVVDSLIAEVRDINSQLEYTQHQLATLSNATRMYDDSLRYWRGRYWRCRYQMTLLSSK